MLMTLKSPRYHPPTNLHKSEVTSQLITKCEISFVSELQTPHTTNDTSIPLATRMIQAGR